MPKLITASFKQRKFVNTYLSTGSKVKAAEEAYGTVNKSTSASLARATLQQPTTIQYMKRILDKAGMSDDKIANGLKIIAEAGLSEQSLKQAKPQDALRALQEAAKLKDLYPAEKKKIEKRTISIDLKNKSDNELQQILEKNLEELKTFTKLIRGGNVQDAQVVS